MKTSETISKITGALLLAHTKITHAHKDSSNPHFRSNYASLESVIDASRDALIDNGLIVLQAMSGTSLVTRLQHSSGEWFESTMDLFLDKQDMQKLGSAITYGRRYSLAAILNISQADDDGNVASGKAKVESIPKKSQAQQNVEGIKAVINEVGWKAPVAPKAENAKTSDYVIQLGKSKMTGTKLSDHSDSWLKKTSESTVQYYIGINKPMHSNAKEFVDQVEKYLGNTSAGVQQ